MSPIHMGNKWYIEVYTEEFGNVLIIRKDCNLPIPAEFNSEQEALKYIDKLNNL